MANTQVREIRVVIDTKGDQSLKAVSRGFRDVNQSIKETNSILNKAKSAFGSIAGFTIAGVGIKSVIDLADSMQKLGNRLETIEGSGELAKNTLERLTTIANANKSSIEDTATIYSRMALSLKDAGVSTESLLSLTDLLQKSFRLSGATTAEATASVIQLSQGLASGQLRGEELRSVLEQNAVIGGLLAKQLGLTRGELLKFAKDNDGIKAVELFKALAAGAEELNEKSAKLKPTVAEAFTTALNDMKLRLDEVNKEFGITEKLVAGIELLSKNLPEIIGLIGKLALAWGAYTIATKGADIATKAFLVTSEALLAVLASPIVGGLVAIVTALGALGSALVVAGGALLYFAATTPDIIGSLSDVASGIWDVVRGFEYGSGKTREIAAGTEKFSLVLKENGEQLRDNTQELNNLIGVDFSKKTKEWVSPLEEAALALEKNKKQTFDFDVELAKINQKFGVAGRNTKAYAEALRALKIQDLNEKFKNGKKDGEEYNKALEEINGTVKSKKKNLAESREEIAKLNAQFKQDKDIRKYAIALEEINLKKLQADYDIGIGNVIDLQLARNTKAINDRNRALAEGVITLEQYRNLNIESSLEALNAEFVIGKKNVYEYHQELIAISEEFKPGSAFFVGTQNYIQQAGTLSQNVAGLVTSTFTKLEETVYNFTKTGKFAFKEFTLSVLDDLNRILIRALVIRPLAQGLLDGIAGGATSTPTGDGVPVAIAQGGVIENGMSYFAQGGVVSKPTYFKYGSGKNGIMGEAGPEAIIPLKRGADGKLGVSSNGNSSQVFVNIENNTGGEVTQTETTNANGDRILDIVIGNKIKENLANGSLDKALKQNYGINRKGT